MEIKVREVTDVEEKSTQQVEQELLDKHEEQFVDSKVCPLYTSDAADDSLRAVLVGCSFI